MNEKIKNTLDQLIEAYRSNPENVVILAGFCIGCASRYGLVELTPKAMIITRDALQRNLTYIHGLENLSDCDQFGVTNSPYFGVTENEKPIPMDFIADITHFIRENIK